LGKSDIATQCPNAGKKEGFCYFTGGINAFDPSLSFIDLTS